MSARNLNAATHRVWLRSQLISFESLGSWFRSRTQRVSNQRGRRQEANRLEAIQLIGWRLPWWMLFARVHAGGELTEKLAGEWERLMELAAGGWSPGSPCRL